MIGRISPAWRIDAFAVVAMVVAWPGGARPVGAEAPAVYQAVGRADAMSAELIKPGAPVFGDGPVVFLSSTTASSSLSSLDTPRAFAAAPYPGDFMVSAPGTMNGLAGTSLPPYPAYTYAEYPTAPRNDLNQGPIALRAASQPADASADATIRAFDGGGGIAVARTSAATRSHLEPDGTTVAEATTVTDGIELPGNLRIGQVTSKVTARRPAGSPDVTRTTDTTITGASVNGVPVMITPEGLKVGPTAVPAPLAGAAALTALLEQDGVRLAMLPSTTSPDGVVSAALSISLTRNQPGDAPVQLHLVFGRAFAATSVNPGAAAAIGVIDSSPIGEEGSTAGEVSSVPAGGGGGSTSIDAAPVGPVADGDLPAGFEFAAPTGSLTGGSAPTSSAPPSASVAPPVLQVLPASLPPGPAPDGTWFYLVLVFASVVAVGSTVVMRRAIPKLLVGLPPTAVG